MVPLLGFCIGLLAMSAAVGDGFVCSEGDCANGGHCSAFGMCVCVPGFRGFDCSWTDFVCSAGDCANGGYCNDDKLCVCPHGFGGFNCSLTSADVEPKRYDFESITTTELITTSAVFDIFGNVTIESNDTIHRRWLWSSYHLHFHQHYGHPCFIEYLFGRHNAIHHYLHSLSSHHHGFTVSFNIKVFSGIHGNMYIFSNGGNFVGYNGASLAYLDNGRIVFQVNSHSRHWFVAEHFTFHPYRWYRILASWHPQLGAHLYINNHCLASLVQGALNSFQFVTSLPLRFGHGHQSSAHSICDMMLERLEVFGAPVTWLAQVGAVGTLNPSPPVNPTPAATVTPVTQPTTVPQTTVPTAARTATNAAHAAPTTTPVPHSVICYTYKAQSSVGMAANMSRCQPGEVCNVFKDNHGYTAKCLDRQVCDLGKRFVQDGTCWDCCNTYLCNDHCKAPCDDKDGCAAMIPTGYDVCGDVTMAASLCPKTCKIC